MEILFWICWIIEMIIVGWWWITDSKHTHLKPNPFIFISMLYLLIVLLLRLELGWVRASEAMVVLPMIPLAGLSLIIVVHMTHKGRWN